MFFGGELVQTTQFKYADSPFLTVLDECQMVESSTAAAATMCLKLPCIHRWCVSGTCIQRGLEDLYGLMVFLQRTPFDNRFWWSRVVQQPYYRGDLEAQQRFHQALKKLMWRNSKLDVATEIELPPQRKTIVEVHFSPVERYFYKKQSEQVPFEFIVLISSTVSGRISKPIKKNYQ
jgi:E3 ubiquitin-protein ligase SHPRH